MVSLERAQSAECLANRCLDIFRMKNHRRGRSRHFLKNSNTTSNIRTNIPINDTSQDQSSENGLVKRLTMLLEGERPGTFARRIGLSASTFNEYFKNGRVPNHRTAGVIAAGFGCSVSYLLTGKGSHPDDPTFFRDRDEFYSVDKAVVRAAARKLQRARVSLEEAAQVAEVVPDAALQQILINWLMKHDLPVEEVAQLLLAKVGRD